MLLIPGAMGIKEWFARQLEWYADGVNQVKTLYKKSSVQQVMEKALVWGVDVVLAAFFLLGDTRVMAIVAFCILGIFRAAGITLALRKFLKGFSWSLFWELLNIRIACSLLFVLAAAVMLLIEGELGAFRASIVLLCAMLGTVGAVVADTDVVLSEQGKAFAAVVLVIPFVFAVSGTGAGAWGTPYGSLAGPLLCIAANIVPTDDKLQTPLYLLTVAAMVVPFAWTPTSLPPLECSAGKQLVDGSCACPVGMAFNETYKVCTNGSLPVDNCGNPLFTDAARFMGGGNACLCNSPHGEFIREFSGCKCAPGWSGLLCTHVNVSNATQ